MKALIRAPTRNTPNDAMKVTFLLVFWLADAVQERNAKAFAQQILERGNQVLFHGFGRGQQFQLELEKM